MPLELFADPPIPGQPTAWSLGTLSATISTTPAAGTVESYAVSAAAPAALRAASGQFHVVIDNELMTVASSASGASPWSFTRGTAGTVATHATGSQIYLVLSAAALALFGQVGSDSTLGGPGGTALTSSVVTAISTAGAPTTGTWVANQAVVDTNGVVWECTVGGTPGTWVQGAGAAAASAAYAVLAKAFDQRRRQANALRDQPQTFDRWVDQVNGVDTNDGLTPATAWKTLAKVNTSGTVGLRIGLKRGCTWRETFTVPADTMVFGAYGPMAKPAPLIKGSMDYSAATWTLVSGSTWQATITAPGSPAGAAFLTNDTPLYSVGTAAAVTVGTYNITGTTFTIWLPDSSNPNGKQIEVTDNAGIGITDQKVGTIWQDIAIKHWTTYTILRQPALNSAGGAIRRCDIGPSAGQLINWSQTQGGFIEDNNIHGGWSGVDYPSGAGVGIGLQKSPGMEIRYNRIADCYQGIYMSNTGNRELNVHHNRVFRSKVNDINFNNGDAGFPPTITHNLVLHRPSAPAAAGHGIVSQVSNVGPIWRNNLVVTDYTGTPTNVQLYCLAVTGGTGLAGTDVDYNLGWVYPGSSCNYGKVETTNYATFAQWRAAVAALALGGGTEQHSVNADPLLTNLAAEDVTLQPGSPAINAGQVLGYPSEVYLGTAPDIGAYEVS